ncbi:MAG: metalloregulator ArsR/SmtB family transcription factor [Patescibacteria group bacterium]
MRHYEKILKALANNRRLEIVKYLKQKKEASVGDIAKHIKLSFKSTSRHLAILLGADILEKEQRNVSVFYSLAPKLVNLAKSIVSEI